MVIVTDGTAREELPEAVLISSPSTTNTGALGADLPEATNADAVLHVTRSPYAQIQSWHDDPAADPTTEIGVVALGSLFGTRRIESAVSAEIPVSVTSVTRPVDVARVGTEMVSILSEWRERDVRILVSVNSLSLLIADASLRHVFKATVLLQEYLARLDALALYHFHPEHHDEETVKIVESLFDVIIELPVDEERDRSDDRSLIALDLRTPRVSTFEG